MFYLKLPALFFHKTLKDFLVLCLNRVSSNQQRHKTLALRLIGTWYQSNKERTYNHLKNLYVMIPFPIFPRLNALCFNYSRQSLVVKTLGASNLSHWRKMLHLVRKFIIIKFAISFIFMANNDKFSLNPFPKLKINLF